MGLTGQNRIDLSQAVIVAPANPTKVERTALRMLREEIERRTGILLPLSGAKDLPTISLVRGKAQVAAEGFQNSVQGKSVQILAGDERGILYGAGHLLRKLEMRRNRITLAADYRVNSAPETALRGHQLGYRPKTNSYDAWTLAMWEQYIRDLAIFGTNAVELIPPRSDDDADSPHFPKPPMQMMIDMSRTLDNYGMDVWIWYPALDKDYADPKTVDFALNEWGEVFKKLPRVDAILVPAGDPGHTPAKILMPMLEKQWANLRKYHPNAKLWLAPQGFDVQSMDDFFAFANQKPAWLAGVAYGPQTRMTLAELRKKLRADLPIRHYPDLTHSRTAQYPVPDWDTAFAVTLAREPINPRPVDQAAIYKATHGSTVGFITYSEGCNDDVNKFVWSGLGWSSTAGLDEILRDYGRYFIHPDVAVGFAEGLLSLERNWRGPAMSNASIQTTLRQFQQMESAATPLMLANWRFQQALYRAYYDAYIRDRLIYETHLERQAIETLNQAGLGSQLAMDEAAKTLNLALTHRPSAALRVRVLELAEALYQSIRMQLSVAKYQAIEIGRGTTLDTLDVALNNREWLFGQFERIRKLPLEKERQAELQKLIHWANPGPGGFYDDLGVPSASPHLVPGLGFAKDPQYFASPLTFFDYRPALRVSWWNQSAALYELPLVLQYESLDATARYNVRVVYGAGPIRLEANGREIHGYMTKPYEVLEFALPAETTSGGSLKLSWNRTPGGGGTGRGNQVAEVWLLRQP